MTEPLESFERRLMAAIDLRHDCDCEMCHHHQREVDWLAVLAWIGVAEDDQLQWLVAHPEHELRGAFLRDLLARYSSERDLGAIAAEFRRRDALNEQRQEAR